MAELKEFLTVQDVAERLGVTPSRVYQLVISGEMPFVRLGGRLRFPRLLWDRWVERLAKGAGLGAGEKSGAA